VTRGSSTVLDAAVTTSDNGRTVTGSGIPGGAVVSGAVNGVRFTISVGGVPTAATAPAALPPGTVETITIGNPGQPRGCGGIAERSNVVAVEWTVSYTDVADNPGQNDFTAWLGGPFGAGGALLPPPQNGPVALHVDFSGGPQPYTAPASINFRVRDGAGNWTNWFTTNIPAGFGGVGAGD
jgi:hypothetical protein